MAVADRELEGAYLLLKFSRNPHHLEDLLDGKFHCRTAEYYRLCETDGAGDPNESAVLALREGRGLEDWQLTIDDRVIDGVTAFTAWTDGWRDEWLHSWTVVRKPESDETLTQLVTDLNRLQKEFGPDYVAIPAPNIQEAFERIHAASPTGAGLRAVGYTDDAAQRSPVCKDVAYQYQREARFLFGQCPQDAEMVLEFRVDRGLRDLMLLNPDVSMANRKTGAVLFSMDRSGARIEDIEPH